ncbi:MAG: hypothetical protein U0132_17215 [Gemmatimonadaceae bacterium]
MRNAASKLHDLQAALHLTLGVGQDLPVLVTDDCRQLIHVLVEQVAELEHHSGAAQRRRGAPLGERVLRVGNHRLYVTPRRQRHAPRGETGRRVEHGSMTRGGRRLPLAVEEVRNYRQSLVPLTGDRGHNFGDGTRRHRVLTVRV